MGRGVDISQEEIKMKQVIDNSGEGKKSPVLIEVFFGKGKESHGNPLRSEENLGTIPAKCKELTYKFRSTPVEGYKFSPAFRLGFGNKIQAISTEGDFFYIKVPVQTDGSGQHRFLKAPDNHLNIGVTKNDRLEIWAFGLVVFRKQLLKVKHKKYDVRCFQKNGELVIPAIQDSENLSKLISPLVDINSLNDVSNYAANSSNIIPNKGFGRITWVDPFSQRLAIETRQGSAFSLFKHFRNLQLLNGRLVLPKAGDEVKILKLEDPKEKSKTTFNKVATAIEIV